MKDGRTDADGPGSDVLSTLSVFCKICRLRHDNLEEKEREREGGKQSPPPPPQSPRCGGGGGMQQPLHRVFEPDLRQPTA